MGKILDHKRGILDAHAFISTNYISFLIDRRTPAVIPFVNIICWCRAVKVSTPGVPPYVNMRVVPNQLGKAVPEGVPTAIQLYTKDERLHMIFDLAVSYERFCYLFDSTWRGHHPQLMQISAEYQRQRQAQQQRQQQQQMYNFMMGLGMTSFGGYNALGMTGFPAFNPMMTAGLGASPSGMMPVQPQPISTTARPTGAPIVGQRAMPQLAVPQRPIQRPPPPASLSPPGPAVSPSLLQPPPAVPPQQYQQQQSPQKSPQATQQQFPQERSSPEPEGMGGRPESAPLTLGELQNGDESQGAAAGFNVVSSSSSNTASTSPAAGSGERSLVGASRLVEWGAMPLAVTPTELTFELGSRQAPVDEELHELIVLRNNSGSKHSFCFEPAPSSKYALSFEPAEGKINSGKEQSVMVKLTVLCTTEFKLKIPLIAWKGDMKDAERAQKTHAMLTADIESQLTTKLDSDELTLYSPPVGEGSFGTIYRGDYRGADVAVKVLKYQNAITPDMIRDFKSEIGIMEKLRHPCIINFIGAVHTPGKFAIVTEFCPFGNLNGAIKKPTFTYAHKLKALLDTAKGMNFLHRSNIMHRDLKPDNILMVSLEVRSSVICKISDFGTTRDVNRFSHEMSFTKGVGTPIFMAPELLAGRRNYEKSADVYSFGMMMVNLITGKQPFEGDPNITSAFQFANYVIEGHRPSLAGIRVPEDYMDLMKICWSADPAVRPSFDDIAKGIDVMFKASIANMR